MTQATTKRRMTLTEEQKAAKREEAKRIFADSHAERRAQRDALTQSILEFILTAPVPMTEPELYVLHQSEYDTVFHESTYRGIVRELEQAGKIGARKETAEERLVRGGGGKVKATAPKLYGPPEGVPIREKLPKGIKPLKSAVEHAEEKRREKLNLDERVYAAMDVPNVPGSGHGAPRTPHMIAIAADVSDRAAQEALDRMVANGRVFHHPVVGYYSPMTRVRRTTIEKYANGGATRDVTTDLLEDLEVTPAVKAAEARPARDDDPVPTEPAGDLASLVAAEVARALAGAGLEPAGTPDPSDYDAFQRIHELQAENDDLRRQLARSEAAVTGLRQALAALS